MNKVCITTFGLLVGVLGSGCSLQLKEIRSKTQFGPEFRDRPGRRSEVRWTSIDQGFEFKWDNGWATSISYRRRDTDEGNGGNDNRVLLGFSFPIWKASKTQDTTARRIEELELRLARLESEKTGPARESVAGRAHDLHDGKTD